MTDSPRFALPEGGLRRLLVPGLFVVAGTGVAVWQALRGPRVEGWWGLAPWGAGLVFALIGLGTIAGELRRAGARRAGRRALDENRAAPWRVRPEWRGDEVAAEGGARRPSLVFAVLWNLLSWPLAVVLIRAEGPRGDPAVWLVTLFPLIGLAMLARWAVEVRRARKFGPTSVACTPMPARLGRPLQGRILTRLAPDRLPADGVLVRLSCYRQRVRWERDSDGDRSKKIERDLVWRDETRIRQAGTAVDGRAEIDFAFAVPADPPPSTPLKLESRIVWEVSAEAAVPGLDLDARIEIPVFAPDEVAAPPDPRPEGDTPGPDGAPPGDERIAGGAPDADDADAPTERGAPVPGPDAPARGAPGSHGAGAAWPFDEPLTEGIVLVDGPGEFELHFTAARTRRGAVTLGVLGILFGVGGVPLMMASGLMGLIFSVVGAFLVYGSVQQATNDTVLRVAGGRVEVTHDGIGMPDDVALPVAQVDEVVVHLGSGSSTQSSYSLSLQAADATGLEHVRRQADRIVGVLSRFGVSESHPAVAAMQEGARRPRIQVAGQLTDKDEADWLAGRIREALRRESGRGG